MIDSILKNHKILICCGSGGVGKTTLSATLAVRAADLGLNVLVLTIDPAKRLASALGLDSLNDNDVLVPGQNFKGKLYAAMVDAKRVFDNFIYQSSPTKESAETILKNRLYVTLTTSLSGSQEFSSLERLYQAVTSEKYDLVILDTPPAQHAKEFLLAPQRFYALFQESIVKWFLAPEENSGFLSTLLHKTTLTVLKALESLTGSEFMKELAAFFIGVKDIQHLIQDHSIAIQRMLTGSSAGFVVVTSFDDLKLAEAKSFQQSLQRGGYQLAAIIINRAFPEWLHQEATANDANKFIQQSPKLQGLLNYYQSLEQYFVRQKESYNSFEESLEGDVEILRVPDFMNEIHDLDSLTEIARDLGALKG